MEQSHDISCTESTDYRLGTRETTGTLPLDSIMNPPMAIKGIPEISVARGSQAVASLQPVSAVDDVYGVDEIHVPARCPTNWP